MDDFKSAMRIHLVPDVLRKELDYVIDNNMNEQKAREYLTDKNKDMNIFINLLSICDVQGMDRGNCEFYFSIQGLYLNKKDFFCTDIIHIRMHGKTVEFKLINAFDNVENIEIRKKSVGPGTKKFWINNGNYFDNYCMLL